MDTKQVIILTRTPNRAAVEDWQANLAKQNLKTVVINPDEEGLRERLMGDLSQVSFLIDDFDPGGNSNLAELAEIIHRMRPEPRAVVLVSDHNHAIDWVGDLKLMVHHHTEPMGPCYEHLAGKRVFEEVF